MHPGWVRYEIASTAARGFLFAAVALVVSCLSCRGGVFNLLNSKNFHISYSYSSELLKSSFVPSCVFVPSTLNMR